MTVSSNSLEQLDAAILRQAIMETCSGIMITDAKAPSNPIVFVNPAFERISGYRESDVIGRNPRFLQGDTPSPATRQLRGPLRDAIKDQHRTQAQIENFRKDGSSYWVEMSIAPLRNTEGEVTHYIGMQADITPLREAKDDLQDIFNQTVVGTVHALVDTLAVTKPAAYLITSRLARLVRVTQDHWPIKNKWQLRCAVLLSHLGCIALDNAIVEKIAHGKRLNDEAWDQWQTHPTHTAKLLEHLPEFAPISNAIARLFQPYTHETDDDEETMLGHILRAIVDYDALVRQSMSASRALAKLAQQQSHHPEVLSQLERMRHLIETPNDGKVWVRQEKRIEELTPGMIAADPIRNHAGVMMLAKGQELNAVATNRLRNLIDQGQISNTVWVMVWADSDASSTADVA